METKSYDSLRAASRFGALAHEARVDIVRLLLKSHPSGMIVGELQDELGIPGSTLSHHLDTLRHEQLVDQEREGRKLRYRARAEELAGLCGFLYRECCSGAGVSLDALREA